MPNKRTTTRTRSSVDGSETKLDIRMDTRVPQPDGAAARPEREQDGRAAALDGSISKGERLMGVAVSSKRAVPRGRATRAI